MDAEASSLPHSQLILRGTTPRGTDAGVSTHLQSPVVSLAAAEGLGDGVITLEEKDELARMGEHDSEPGPVQAQLGFGPILNFTPDPVSPAPAATPDTISSTERMSSSPRASTSLSQDPEYQGPVFRMAASLVIPG